MGLRMSNCVVVDNSAVEVGAAIFSMGSSRVITDCLIAHNAVATGDRAIRTERATIVGCTVADNGPLGIYVQLTDNVISNSIVWGNAGQQIGGAVPDVSYSDIEGGYPGEGNIDADPQFVDPLNGDYRLRSSSPCIDAGDPNSPLDPDGSRADMGAFYYDHIIDVVVEHPGLRTELVGTYPNPFNPLVSIHYTIAEAGPTTIAVYNALGQPVKTLVSGQQAVGYHVAVWDGFDGAGRRAASGVYLVRMKRGAYKETRRVTLMR